MALIDFKDSKAKHYKLVVRPLGDLEHYNRVRVTGILPNGDIESNLQYDMNGKELHLTVGYICAMRGKLEVEWVRNRGKK